MQIRHFSYVLTMMLLSGCGKSGTEVAPVSGRVTLDGQPYKSIDVLFQPEGSKRASSGRTDEHGYYELAYKRGEMGALVGEHTVHLSISHELVPNPPVISAASNADLRREVKPGKNEFNFDVTSEKK